MPRPVMHDGGNTSVQTSATGATYVAFASRNCRQLCIVNNSGADIEFRQGATGVAIAVLSGQSFPIFGLSNASQIDLRRVDQSNSQVTVTARWES